MLRALDTVEDDMTIPNDEKIPMLRQFHTYLQDPEWKYIKSQEKDRRVLEEFPVVGICILYSIIPSILDIRQHFHDQVSGRDKLRINVRGQRKRLRENQNMPLWSFSYGLVYRELKLESSIFIANSSLDLNDLFYILDVFCKKEFPTLDLFLMYIVHCQNVYWDIDI